MGLELEIFYFTYACADNEALQEMRKDFPSRRGFPFFYARVVLRFLCIITWNNWREKILENFVVSFEIR